MTARPCLAALQAAKHGYQRSTYHPILKLCSHSQKTTLPGSHSHAVTAITRLAPSATPASQSHGPLTRPERSAGVRCSPTCTASAALVAAINSTPVQTVTYFFWVLKTLRSNRVDGVSIPFSACLYISRRLCYKHSYARYALKGIRSRPKVRQKYRLNRFISDFPVPSIPC